MPALTELVHCPVLTVHYHSAVYRALACWAKSVRAIQHHALPNSTVLYCTELYCPAEFQYHCGGSAGSTNAAGPYSTIQISNSKTAQVEVLRYSQYMSVHVSIVHYSTCQYTLAQYDTVHVGIVQYSTFTQQGCLHVPLL